ncbi:hypothetical protein [Streptomyces sp. NPDC001415]
MHRGPAAARGLVGAQRLRADRHQVADEPAPHGPVLGEGEREDLERFLDQDLLIGQWPVLRTLISSYVRDMWEGAFPELGSARAMTAC